jgi:molybdopterin converting factor small subunit
VQVRVRLGAGLSRLSKAPALTLVLEDGATVDDLLARLRDSEPELAPALRSALPVIGGVHAERRQRLEDRQEIALLLPVSGGCPAHDPYD